MVSYNKLSELGKIGISAPKEADNMKEGPSLPLKFRPPKFPVNSKKIYRGIFIRSMKPFLALYDVKTSIYIVSLLKSHDETTQWIDDNYQTIMDRVISVSRQNEE